MVLKLAEAKRIVDGAIRKAQELKVEISVAVCNHQGHVIALNRMDGVSVGDASAEAMGKAIASAAWGVPSHEGTGRANRGPARAVLGQGVAIVRSRGGLPIRHGDVVEGGCGVCGADDLSQDEECARAGLAAL
jgi:uncharacterized protein GlcG (DUF336 family)